MIHDVGNFEVCAVPDGKHFSVLVHEKKHGAIFYVDLLTDTRFDWFGWRHKIATFEEPLTQDRLVEYNDRVNTVFWQNRKGAKMEMPVQKLTSSSLDQLLALCEKLSKKSSS